MNSATPVNTVTQFRLQLSDESTEQDGGLTFYPVILCEPKSVLLAFINYLTRSLTACNSFTLANFDV